MQIHRGRCDRGVAQVVAHAREFRCACNGMTRVGMPHPVSTRAVQLFGERRMIVLKYLGGLQEEPLHHVEKGGFRSLRPSRPPA